MRDRRMRGEGDVELRLPLPRALDELLGNERPKDGDNLGLWLDKLVRVDKNDDWSLRKESRVKELERLFCPHDLGSPRHWRSHAAEQALARMEHACEVAYGGRYRSLSLRVQGRLLVDYGRVSGHETALSLHPVLGCPRIPGSAFKGLVRAWLREEWADEPNRLRDLLGGPDVYVEDDDPKQQRGRLVFHDALPEEGKFMLAVDVLTPHARDYYEGDEPKRAPSDWLSPIPHTFLTVVDTTFRMFIGLMTKGEPENETEDPLSEIEEVLYNALEIEGIGAKRAAGYGRLMKVKT